MRKVKFANNEYYHIYNRGVDKRTVFEDKSDYDRFLESLLLFNSTTPVGGIKEIKLKKNQHSDFRALDSEKLVEVVSYCLNLNHYHLILRQLIDDGVSRFMRYLSGGYTLYFNEKYDRSGSLFQGPFKAIHIDNDAYFMHLGVYVTLNNYCHRYSEEEVAMTRSSLGEYFDESDNSVCTGYEMIVGNAKNKEEYLQANYDTLRQIQHRKEEDVQFNRLCLD